MTKRMLTGFVAGFAVLFSLVAGANICFSDSDQQAKPGLVTFTDKEGKNVEVLAMPGQVQVMFKNPSPSTDEARELIKQNGGEVIILTANNALCLVKMPAGKEGEFISSISADPRIELATPNLVLSPDK